MNRRVLIAVAALGLSLGILAAGCAKGSPDGEFGGEGGGGGDVGSDAGPIDAGPVDAAPDVGPITCTTNADCSSLENPCGHGACQQGSCVLEPLNELGACDDGQFCTENDTCVAGQCVGGTDLYCPSPDNCHLGICDEEQKTCTDIVGNDGAQCDDDDPCTGAGVCNGGNCGKGASIDCTVFDTDCTVGFCDPATGCMSMTKNEGGFCGSVTTCSTGKCEAGACTPIPQNEGADCDDGMFNPCSQGSCENAKCVSHPKNEGDACQGFFGECTNGACMSGLCQPVPANDGAPCDDFVFCTQDTTCTGGICGGGTPTICAPPGGCWIATCDEFSQTCSAIPGNDGAVCDDGNACTLNTTCAGGACLGGSPTNEGGACDDGKSCTTGETCTNGVCSGGAGPTIYFSDDFSDNTAGWLLGPEWQIGPAMMSSGGVFGADPAADHTLTQDNGVAGVVIGGNENPILHPYYYLESPPFDTNGAPGQVILSFYRWLNSDYDPFMHNTIEVWNGVQWVTLWTSGPSPGVEDSPPIGMGWTYIQHDLTAYKNAAMKVRFGFDIQSGGVYTIGSWNVDDVVVAAQPCP